MIKVEAVVIRERVETVIDAVEDATGHVGVTVVEAIGHGRQRGVTHEYRGRVFESRFLPKALLTFIVDDGLAPAVVAAVADAAQSGNESGDGLVWTSRVDERHPPPHRPPARAGRGRMKTGDLLIAANTVWVVIAAILVMFMQAGFAFLEAGLTRMKNAGAHRRQERADLRVCSLVYWPVGFGLAFGDGNALVGDARLLPLGRRAALDRRGAVRSSRRSRARPAICSRSSSPASRWRSSGARWPSARSSGSTSRSASFHAHLLGRLALDLARGRLALRARACRTSPARPSCTTRARSPRSPARCCSGRGSASSATTARERDPRPQHAVRRARHDHPLVRVVRLQPGLDARRRHRRPLGYFAYVALTTNLAAAAGALGGIAVAWIVLKKPDVSMMLNGVIAALVAITAACGSSRRGRRS